MNENTQYNNLTDCVQAEEAEDMAEQMAEAELMAEEMAEAELRGQEEQQRGGHQ